MITNSRRCGCGKTGKNQRRETTQQHKEQSSYLELSINQIRQNNIKQRKSFHSLVCRSIQVKHRYGHQEPLGSNTCRGSSVVRGSSSLSNGKCLLPRICFSYMLDKLLSFFLWGVFFFGAVTFFFGAGFFFGALRAATFFFGAGFFFGA
jgi:hypothetical protein